MLYLDCHNLETILASIVGAIGVRADKLAQTLRDYDESRFESRSEDPEKLMPREVLEQFGTTVDDVRFGEPTTSTAHECATRRASFARASCPLIKWSSRSG